MQISGQNLAIGDLPIRGIGDRTLEQIYADLDRGARFVFFEYCISLFILTLRCPSRIVFLQPGEPGIWRGLPYSLVSLLLGWWGIPWGIIYTPLALMTNFSGGRDVTAQVRPFVLSRLL